MNKILLFLFIFVITNQLISDDYDEAIKYEAKGDFINFKIFLDNYFNKNINNEEQEVIVNKLLYSSTLFSSVHETIDYLLNYVKYMESQNSRHKIYIKIAELYELIGRLELAGKYYEKAAYVITDNIDYNSLINSIEILSELGYEDLSIKVLEDINLLESNYLTNKVNFMLSYLYNVKGDLISAKKYLSLVEKNYSNYGYLYYLINKDIKYLNNDSLDYKIAENSLMKLRNLTDFYSLSSEVNSSLIVDKKSNNLNEIFIKSFEIKTNASGTVNILEQLNYEWYLDFGDNNLWNLYVLTIDKNTTLSTLKDIGIIYE